MTPDHFNPVETERLNAVQRYHNFHLLREKDLEEIVAMASFICKTPIALITLMDKEVQHIKAKIGTTADQMPRKTSFCTHAIEIDQVMVVNDASLDIRFENAPVVVNAPHIRFYASANLKTYDGYNVGTLCVYDVRPKKLNAKQLECLATLARQVSHLMELDRSMNQLEQQNKDLREIARIESHEIRQPVSSILGIMSLFEEIDYSVNKEYMELLHSAVHQLDERIRTIVHHTDSYLAPPLPLK